MYEINPMPPQVDPALLELLVQCRTETIGHQLREHQRELEMTDRQPVERLRRHQ